MDRQSSQQPFRLYYISSAPFVNRAYAICTVFRDPVGVLKSEAFVLLQPSVQEGRAFGTRYEYTDDADGKSSIVMDEAFALDDALAQAETMYSVRAGELDPNLLQKLGWMRPNFSEIPQHRLAGIWAYTPLGQAMLEVASKSGCKALSDLIHSISKLPKFRAGEKLL